MSKELQAQSMFAQYVALQYPDLVCQADANGKQAPTKSVRRKGGVVANYAPQAIKMKKAGARRGFPDWFCYRPKAEQRIEGGVKQLHVFHGLALEFKAPNVCPFYKNGSGKLKSDVHVQEQYQVLNQLRGEGYAAFFVWGNSVGDVYDNARWTLDTYLHNRKRVEAIDEFWRKKGAVYEPINSFVMAYSAMC